MQLLPLDQANHEPVEPTFRRLGLVVHAILNKITIRDWRDQHKVPRTGGVIFVANHIGNFDVLALGEYLIWAGRWPRFLGKSDIFRLPLLGHLARACGQIPVERRSARAKDALLHAAKALDEGKAVVLYPEGTITGDPDVWPMVARTGAARLALQTGYPVVPLGQMGAQLVLGQKRLTWPRLIPKKTMSVICGDPIDLGAFRGLDLTKEVLEEVSDLIMDEITGLVEQIRGQRAPQERYDIRVGRRVPRRR